MKMLTASGTVVAFTEREFEILKFALEFALAGWTAKLEKYADPLADYTKHSKFSNRVTDLNSMCEQLFEFDDDD